MPDATKDFWWYRSSDYGRHHVSVPPCSVSAHFSLRLISRVRQHAPIDQLPRNPINAIFSELTLLEIRP